LPHSVLLSAAIAGGGMKRLPTSCNDFYCF